MSSDVKRPRLLVTALAAILAVAACSSGGSSQSPAGGGTAVAPPSGGASGTVTVAMVGNPQMKALESLKGEFEKTHPNIKVNLLILPENELRAKVTTDVATGASTFDLVTVGMYEVPL